MEVPEGTSWGCTVSVHTVAVRRTVVRSLWTKQVRETAIFYHFMGVFYVIANLIALV